MPRITNIQARKGTATDWSTQNPVLASGELGYDLTNKILKLGDGTSSWTSLGSINLSSSNITDFNSSVSGVLPVKNISAGDNITISSVSGVYTISSTGGGASSGFSWSAIPGSPTSSGIAGDIAYDSEYFYIATNNNVWKRAALLTWIVPSPTPTITNSPTNTPIVPTPTTTSTVTPTFTVTPTSTVTPTFTVTPTSTVTPTPSSVFDTILVIASGSNSASANGATLTGASGSSMRFNQTSPINNPLSFTDIRIYLSGAYTYRITTYTEVITANKTFVLVTNTGTSYISSFGTGTDFGSYRRIDL